MCEAHSAPEPSVVRARSLFEITEGDSSDLTAETATANQFVIGLAITSFAATN